MKNNIVGKPMAQLLLKESMNVTVLHSKTPEAEKRMFIRHADLIVVATGHRHTLTADYELKPIDSSDDSIYFVEKEDGVMTYSFFTGYINNSNFHVGIDLEWNPYINNGLWRVHLIVNSD